jgi:hypothetical protein
MPFIVGGAMLGSAILGNRSSSKAAKAQEKAANNAFSLQQHSQIHWAQL